MIIISIRSLFGRFATAILASILVTLFIACGAGSTAQAVRPSSGSVSGYVVDGPIRGGSVQIYSFEGGEKGLLLGSAKTNDVGYFVVPALRRSTETPILVEVTSGVYDEDIASAAKKLNKADKLNFGRVSLGSTDKLTALGFFSPATAITINVTPYTYIATGLAEYYISLGTAVSQAIMNANTAISRLLGHGIDILATRPRGVIDAEPGATLFTNEYAYGLYTGAFSAYAKSISDMSNATAFETITAIGLAQKMYKDIKDDGLLDGVVYYDMSLKGERKRDTLEYGSVALTSVGYRRGLGQGALKIVNARNDTVRLNFEEMVHLAHNFAESNDPLFGFLHFEPFDVDPPVFNGDANLEIVNARTDTDVLGNIIKYVTYFIDVTDPVGVHRVSVMLDGNQRLLSENIVPNGNRIELAANGNSGVGPGEHTLTVVAVDTLGNESSKVYQIIVPDGKPTVSLKSLALTNQANYQALGGFTDDSGMGIRAISVGLGTQSIAAQIDAVAQTWSATLPLVDGENTLTIKITDKNNNFREVVRSVTLDKTPPTLQPGYSLNAEYYSGGTQNKASLEIASATSDPLYVPISRIGYDHPTAPISDLDTAKIPYYTFTVSDQLFTNANAFNAPSDIAVSIKYSIGGVVVVENKPLLTSVPITSTSNPNERTYVLPLIRQTLIDRWYESKPSDVHHIDIEARDLAGNVTKKSVEFKAFFDLYQLHIYSNIKNGRALLHEYKDGQPRGELGACTTDNSGQCAVRLLIDAKLLPQFLHVEISGGTYKEFATNTDVPLASGEALSGVINYTGGDAQVIVTPYTHMGIGLMQNAVAHGMSDSNAYTQVANDLKAIYGFDVFTTLPADPNALTLPTPLPSAERYALLLAGLSDWTAKVGTQNGTAPHTTYTSVGAAAKFYNDAKADGMLDGVGADDKNQAVALALGNVAINANTYRHDTAAGALNFVASHYPTLSATAMQSVLQNVQDLAIKTSSKFAGQTPVAINAQQAIVSVLSAATTTQANFAVKVRVTPGTVAIGGVTIGGVAATAGANNEWTATVALTQQGRNTVAVRVLDSAANELLVQNTDILLDNIGPTITITTPSVITGVTNNRNFSLAGTATDASGVATVNVRLGTQTITTTGTSWSANLMLSSGNNAITIEALDALGNSASQSLQVNFTATGPLVALTSTLGARTTNNRPQFSGTVDAFGSAYTLKATLKNIPSAKAWTKTIVPNASNAWTLDFFTGLPDSLADGQNTLTFTATATDVVPNVTSVTDFTFVVDTTPPTIVLKSPIAPTNIVPYTLNLEVLDSSGTVSKVTVNNTLATAAANNRWTYLAPAGVPDGTQTYSVQAWDDLGNASPSTPVSVTVDRVPPSITINTPSDGLWVKTSTVVLGYSASETVSLPVTTVIKVNNAVATPDAQGAIPLAEGTNSITIDATDGAGNLATKSITVNRDMSAPQLSVVTAPPATVTVASVNFTVKATDLNLSSIVATATSSGATPVTNTVTYTLATATSSGTGGTLSYNAANGQVAGSLGLGSGVNNIVITAYDRVGNQSILPFNTTLDTTAPTASIANTGTISGSTVVTTQSALSISASDTNTGNSGIQSVAFTSSNNSTPRVVTAATSGVYTDTFAQTADGSYTYTVVVTDGAGLTTTLSPTFVRDTTAPTLTISAPTNNSTTLSASATVTVSVSDGNPLPNPIPLTVKVGGTSILTQNIPNASNAKTINNYSFSLNLQSGQKQYDLTVVDAYNKTSAVASVTVTYTSDTTAPTASIANSGVVTGNTVTTTQSALKIAASDAGSGVASVTFNGGGNNNPRVVTSAQSGVYTDSYAQTADGTYNYTIEVKDVAGNTKPLTPTLVLDTVAPVFGTIPTSSTTATLTLTVTELHLKSITVNGASVAFTTNGSTNTFNVTLVTGTNNLTLVATDDVGYVTNRSASVNLSSTGMGGGM